MGEFSGNTSDSLEYHRNSSFSTYDRDNDKWHGNCARSYKAGWWYNACAVW
ncbi:hypothetical protein KR222_007192 [Zaprionus bogoriensis]|nr:hypothetical protein KR222_007192 [Zaprionus bogoriensis]